MATNNKTKTAKSSKVVKPQKKTRRSTYSAKNHRFQTFSERIANLKIDPVRRRRNVEDREELSKDTATYFGRSLDQWRDLNLSQTFTCFVREAAPLCDSLPVVLHNEDKIIEVLMTYIEKQDGLAMEPLLSLLSHFAHDLDALFEKHFQRAVATVAAVAANHSDPAVVEWSFTCLAWLFKYLSRLLITDLRPLYDLMSPYLGKERQRPFVIRFAAESLSFLLRKAAALHERDATPLDSMVSHMLEDCASSNSNDFHRQGVMTILTESIKGVQNGIHSSGLALLESLLREAELHPVFGSSSLNEIVTGTLTSIIHHTNAETFRPVQDCIVQHTDGNIQHSALFRSQLILTVASVRKGTRISSWTPLVQALVDLVREGHGSVEMDTATRFSVLSALAVVFQSATIDAVLPALRVSEILRTGSWTAYFTHFCDLFARLGSERFQNFLLPQLQKFIVQQWHDNEDAILSLLPRLALQGQTLKLNLAEESQDMVLRQIHQIDNPSVMTVAVDKIIEANGNLAALKHITLKSQKRRELSDILLSLAKQGLKATDDTSREFNDLALGPCLAALLDDSDTLPSALELWPLICTQSHRFVHLPQFWSNVHRLLEFCTPSSLSLQQLHTDELRASLLRCLSMPSHSVRQSALDIIQLLFTLVERPVPDAVSAAGTIESTPASLETSRSISLNIRRLSSHYTEANQDEFVQKAVPTYCFGILHFKLSQAWDDAMNVIVDVASTSIGEEIITSLAQDWLEGPRDHQAEASDTHDAIGLLNVESTGFRVVSDFECSNLAKFSAICKQVFETSESGYLSKRDQFRSDIAPVPRVSGNAREQALRVLNKIPNVAEKRSRMLVPVLLRWAGNIEAEPSDMQTESTPRWNRKDQKAMLDCFAKFTNPRVLFKSSEVYTSLLHLCANGDADIQRAALKAICAWKDPAISQYEARLNNLLDESRFRDEISTFLEDDDNDEEGGIHLEHRNRLMPVLLRLLYGRAVAGGKHGQSSRRKAIFIALAGSDAHSLQEFLTIALGSTANVQLMDGATLNEQALVQLKMPLRQQVGMLNMLYDYLDTSGTALQHFTPKLLDSVLLCAVAASRGIENFGDNPELQEISLRRSVRQVGVQCLIKIFSGTADLAYLPCVKIIMDEMIARRLHNFAVENAHSVSGVLRLMSVWSSSPKLVQYLLDCHPDTLNCIAELLREPSAKDEVRLFVLRDILDNLLLETVQRSLMQAYASEFVESIRRTLEQQPSKAVLDACVLALTKLSHFISNEQEAVSIFNICAGLLTKSSNIVSPWTKSGLLKTILPLLDGFDLPLATELFEAICGLFSRMHEIETRVLLSNVFVAMCRSEPQLVETVKICADLNAVGDGLDEADHNRRESGFMTIYDKYDVFTVQQWKPILHNCLHYIRDANDMVNRTSASQALERFVDAAARQTAQFRPIVMQVLLPGIEYGVKSKSELVRAEYLRLLGRLVESFPDWSAVNDMGNLTVGTDDEASFFTNVLHIQQHRRLRALRRLSDEASSIKSANVSKIFIPLLEHFIFDAAEGDSGRVLSDQAVATVGAIATVANWPVLRTTFNRYVSNLSNTEGPKKTVLRLLGVLVDAMETSSTTPEKAIKPDAMESRMETIKQDFLPSLTGYVHHKDESTVDRRMPAAVTIVKLLLLLPELEMSARLTPLLSDVCNVLKSRSQEARDQARTTLVSILSLVGPSQLIVIVKELRSFLQRGYQLHVLSYTVHSLLVKVVEQYHPRDLDTSLPEITAIIMDDIFGVTGQEKDAEEYKSGMKEVKSSKSYDTMELLARVTPIHRLGQLIKPIRALLSEKIDARMLMKSEALLTRLRKGVDQNPASGSRDMLAFCHEIVRQVNTAQSDTSVGRRKVDYKVSRYLIQMDPIEKSSGKSATTTQIFKLVSFAFNLLRKVIRRHDDLMTPANLAGFLPMAGDALVQGVEDVQISAARLLSTVMGIPLTELDLDAPVYLKEAVRVIKTATSTTTDSVKAALELITSILREKRSVQVRDGDIAAVLKALKSEIDEPDQRGIIYKFLAAVLGRKIMATEVYEVMDEVRKAIVTNADGNIRQDARKIYLQFTLDYPQGKDRWNKQAAFWVENLKYEHSAGRKSVMELIHQLLQKLEGATFAQLAYTLFLALVPVQVSDTDQSCRETAKLLIAKLFEKATEEQIAKFLALMEKWLQNETNSTIQIAALQCWTVVLRANKATRQQLSKLHKSLQNILVAEEGSPNDGDLDLNALTTFDALIAAAPEIAYDEQSASIWKGITESLASSQAETQKIAASLQRAYFSHLASDSAKAGAGLSKVPLRGSGGLELTGEDMRRICQISLKALRSTSSTSDEALVAQISRNLVFLGRCFASSGLLWQYDTNQASEDEENNGLTESPINKSTALGYLFNRLSYIIRQDSLAVVARTAAVESQSGLINHVETVPDLQSLLRPLYLLTDPSTTQPPGDAYRNLIDSARQLLDNVQKKVGAEIYVSTLSKVRSEAKVRREDRRQKRRIEAVSAPEKWAREKRKKYDTKRIKHKEKGAEARGRRRGW